MEIYDKLWKEAVAAFERGEVGVVPYLCDKTKDLRRGVTLVVRPSAAVREAVAGYIERLREICPEQYFYRAGELHLTVLAVFSGTEHWEREMERVPKCRQILQGVLKKQRPFKIKFRGVTASRDSVMVRGWPLDGSLEVIRNAIREAFAKNGLGDMLDRRYKAAGAHLTIMRFRKPCPHSKRLLEFLKENREADFGETEATVLELNFADWYASAGTTQILEEYRLGN